MKDEIESLTAVFKEDVIEKLLSFAMMRWAYQSPIKRATYYHAHDFCSEHWSKDSLSDKQISAALKFVGENREALVIWVKAQLQADTKVAPVRSNGKNKTTIQKIKPKP